MNTDDSTELRARVTIMERAWVELTTHLYMYGLINDAKIDEMAQNMANQTKGPMEAAFLYSLFWSFRNTPQMHERQRGLAELAAFEAKHGKIGG